MVETWAETLESLPLAMTLRGSVWAYPLINTGHILGVALMVGGIAPLDLRLLGAWPSVSVAHLWRVLVYTAAAGMALAVTCGVLLFITRATTYVNSTLFTAKMVFFATGVINALILHSSARSTSLSSSLPKPVRIQAALSLFIWLAVLTLGRLVGYF